MDCVLGDERAWTVSGGGPNDWFVSQGDQRAWHVSQRN